MSSLMEAKDRKILSNVAQAVKWGEERKKINEGLIIENRGMRY